MSHVNNKFVKAANQGDGPTAGCFSNLLKSFFARTYLWWIRAYSARKVAWKAKHGNEGTPDGITQPVGKWTVKGFSIFL